MKRFWKWTHYGWGWDFGPVFGWWLVWAWACYWVCEGVGLLPRAWQHSWPIGPITWRLFPYAAWWALRQNPNLPDELKREMRTDR